MNMYNFSVPTQYVCFYVLLRESKLFISGPTV